MRVLAKVYLELPDGGLHDLEQRIDQLQHMQALNEMALHSTLDILNIACVFQRWHSASQCGPCP